MQVKVKISGQARKVNTRTLETTKPQGCGTLLRSGGERLRHPPRPEL